MSSEWDKYIKPKDKGGDKPAPAPEQPQNATQNLAPTYDPMGSYTGTEAPTFAPQPNEHGEDVIKAVKSFGRGTDAFVRGAADVLTLGAMDRLAAGASAATGVGGEFGEYSKNLATQRAATKADETERAPVRVMGQLAGGIVGPAKGLRVLQNATTLPGRMVGGGVAGATAAFPYGYFSSEADLGTLEGQGQALKDGGKAGLTGLALGASLPAVGNAIGRAVDYVRNRVSPDQFSNLPRATQRNLEQLSRDMDLPRVQSEARRLGDNAMLADVSPDMRLLAQNAATRPGVSSMVADPLRARDAARNERLNEALNNTFGKNIDRTVVNDRLSQLRGSAGNEFERLSATARNDMPAFDVLSTIDRLKMSPDGRNPGVARALSDIEKVLTNPRTGNVGKSASEFHAARKLADEIYNESTSTSVKTAVDAIRKNLDAALKQGVGGWPAADARFADIAGRQAAFEKGQTVFNTGREALRPDEYNRYLSGLNPWQNKLERVGARAELDRLAGQANNDLAAFNNALKLPGDDPARKMQLLFGADPTRRFYNAKEAENIFAATNNAVNNGSQTAQRQGANQLLSAGSGSSGAGAPMSVPEAMMAAKKRVADAFRDAAYGRVNEDSARQLARMTVAQGRERDAFIRALEGRANRTDPELDIERTLKALRPGIVAGLLN